MNGLFFVLSAVTGVFGPGASGPAVPEANSVEGRLLRGDFQVLDELKAARQLDDLYRLSNVANWRPYEIDSQKIVAATKERLHSIPDHALYVADKVEELTNRKGTYREREGLLYSLKRASRPQAVAQIGRFIYDERNPDPEETKGISVSPPAPNSHTAGAVLMDLLGGELPFKIEIIYNPHRELPKLRAWWESQAGEQYRKLLAASGRTYAGIAAQAKLPGDIPPAPLPRTSPPPSPLPEVKTPILEDRGRFSWRNIGIATILTAFVLALLWWLRKKGK